MIHQYMDAQGERGQSFFAILLKSGGGPLRSKTLARRLWLQ
jgi:hypothetical protein